MLAGRWGRAPTCCLLPALPYLRLPSLSTPAAAHRTRAPLPEVPGVRGTSGCALATRLAADRRLPTSAVDPPVVMSGFGGFSFGERLRGAPQRAPGSHHSVVSELQRVLSRPHPCRGLLGRRVWSRQHARLWGRLGCAPAAAAATRRLCLSPVQQVPSQHCSSTPVCSPCTQSRRRLRLWRTRVGCGLWHARCCQLRGPQLRRRLHARVWIWRAGLPCSSGHACLWRRSRLLRSSRRVWLWRHACLVGSGRRVLLWRRARGVCSSRRPGFFWLWRAGQCCCRARSQHPCCVHWPQLRSARCRRRRRRLLVWRRQQCGGSQRWAELWHPGEQRCCCGPRPRQHWPQLWGPSQQRGSHCGLFVWRRPSCSLLCCSSSACVHPWLCVCLCASGRLVGRRRSAGVSCRSRRLQLWRRTGRSVFGSSSPCRSSLHACVWLWGRVVCCGGRGSQRACGRSASQRARSRGGRRPCGRPAGPQRGDGQAGGRRHQRVERGAAAPLALVCQARRGTGAGVGCGALRAAARQRRGAFVLRWRCCGSVTALRRSLT